MSVITVSEARMTLFDLIRQVNAGHVPIEVVSRHGSAVLLSKKEFDSLTETADLLRNPVNAERLLESIRRARRGEFTPHGLRDA